MVNPQSLDAFAVDVGALPIDLHEITLHRDGPRVRLRFDVAAVPHPLPARWDGDANRTQVQLACFGVSVRVVGLRDHDVRAGDDAAGRWRVGGGIPCGAMWCSHCVRRWCASSRCPATTILMRQDDQPAAVASGKWMKCVRCAANGSASPTSFPLLS